MTDQNHKGGDQNGSGKADDPTNQKGTESLKGKVDEQGIPLDAEERAEHFKKLSEDNEAKFKNSSKGAQELLNKNKILAEENETIKKSRDPNHKEENVSRSEIDEIKTRQDEIEKQQRLEANKREFNTQCKNLIEQDEFKNIGSLKDEFEEYAYKEENLNSPIEILARSFQVEKGLLKSKKEEEGDEGRKGLEAGTGGGDHSKPSEKGYTNEQAEKMRTEDPKKYNRLAKEGRLNIVD